MNKIELLHLELGWTLLLTPFFVGKVSWDSYEFFRFLSKHLIQNTQDEISALVSVLVYQGKREKKLSGMKAPMMWQQ